MDATLIAAATGTDTAETLEQLGALTLSDWLWAAGLTIGAVLAAVGVFRLVVRLSRDTLAPLVARLVGRLAASVVFLLGFLYAMQQVGVSLAPLLGLLGLFGLALAFAFQEVLENFIAGIFLSARRPFAHGDEITTADHRGTVEDISLRELTLVTYDGEHVFVPNAAVWRNPIVNHTRNAIRRTTVDVGVAYESSLEEAQRILLETLRSVDGVEDDPAPQALAYELGDSSINFALRFWHAAPVAAEWKVRNTVVQRVHAALGEAGIEIPFPQRVVELHRRDG
jgi:small-conductance mechanosensitive channel